MNNMGDPEMINKLNAMGDLLTKAIKDMGHYGKEFAQNEKNYKIVLSKHTARLRNNGTPVSLIQLEVYGIDEVAEKRFQRDLARIQYETTSENINALKLKMRLLEAQIDREWRG